MYKLILIGLGSMLFSACSPTSKETTDENTQPVNSVAPTKMDDFMADIDGRVPNMSQGMSLKYMKEDHSIAQTLLYVDSAGNVLKMMESVYNGKTGEVVRNHFYFNAGMKYATKNIEEVHEPGKEPYYREIVTFYDNQEKPLSSKMRTAKFEEELDYLDYQKTTAKDISMDNARAMLELKGPYVTTFQGFVDSGPYSFLIVGENKDDGYTSSLSIQVPSRVIDELRRDGIKALGKPLAVQFETVVDEQGYEMQILTDVQYAK